jgi:two-component system, response regulator
MRKDGPAILLVDNNRNDVEITIRAFRQAGFENPIFTVHDKPEAIRFLHGDGKYADRSSYPLPRLVLLDHKTPGEEWQITKWVRNDRKFKDLPIAVLTGSQDPTDEKKALKMGVNAYHLKPQDFDEFVALIRRIAEFWLPGGGLRNPSDKFPF